MPSPLPLDDPRHGTRTAWAYWRCSCDRCAAGREQFNAALRGVPYRRSRQRRPGTERPIPLDWDVWTKAVDHCGDRLARLGVFAAQMPEVDVSDLIAETTAELRDVCRSQWKAYGR